MKNDSTTTFLNFVLAGLVFLSVGFAILTIWQTHQMTLLATQAQQINGTMQRLTGLVNDTMAYNANAHSSELTHAIQVIQSKPAAH